jgi:hypothetical protein
MATEINSFKHKGQTFRHGDKVTCIMDGTVITDAKISVNDGMFFICQNHRNGDAAADLLGYKHSWSLSLAGDSGVKLSYPSINVRDLKLVTPDYEIF